MRASRRCRPCRQGRPPSPEGAPAGRARRDPARAAPRAPDASRPWPAMMPRWPGPSRALPEAMATSHQRRVRGTAQECSALFGQADVDAHARADLEAGNTGHARDHSDVPVVVRQPPGLGWWRANAEVVVGVLEAEMNLAEHGAEQAGKSGGCGGGGFAETGTGGQRIDAEVEEEH